MPLLTQSAFVIYRYSAKKLAVRQADVCFDVQASHLAQVNFSAIFCYHDNWAKTRLVFLC